MPIRTQSDLPAKEILEKENIFVMDENRAMHQAYYPANPHSDFKPYAFKRGHGTADFKIAV